MSEFALTTLFVLPPSNALPTTPGTQNLADGQFGVFKDETRTIATNGNISTAKFIQFFQGREATIGAQLGSKPSDKITASRVKSWYKVTGSAVAANEIWQVGAFTAGCDEDLTLTILAHSSYLDTISYNGLERSITIKTPCCDCGDSPCATVDNETIINLFLQKIAQIDAVQVGPTALKIDTFFTFTKVGTGDAAVIRIESKPLTKYGQPCDVAADPYEFDRIWFRTFVYKAPATTVDFIVYDACDQVATVTELQRSSFPRLTSTEVAQLEFDYYSYQAGFKHLFRNPGFNPYFESFVVPGTIYTQYVVRFDPYVHNNTFMADLKQDEKVIIMIPSSDTSTIETMLTTYLGAPVDESGPVITTTTSTSTSSTSSTSTTTTLIP